MLKTFKIFLRYDIIPRETSSILFSQYVLEQLKVQDNIIIGFKIYFFLIVFIYFACL